MIANETIQREPNVLYALIEVREDNEEVEVHQCEDVSGNGEIRRRGGLPALFLFIMMRELTSADERRARRGMRGD